MTMQVPVSAEIAAQIASFIAAFPARAPEELRWLASYVATFDALPLYLGWTETIGIRPSGEIVRWSTEGDYAGTRPVDDWSWVLTALVKGADRYPELRPLLPVRRTDAIDCTCRAIPLCVSGNVGCASAAGSDGCRRPAGQRSVLVLWGRREPLRGIVACSAARSTELCWIVGVRLAGLQR